MAKEQKKNIDMEISANAVVGQPENVFELINKYGTYEIQTTADTDNQYPAIAQGFNEKIFKTDRQNPRNGTKKW